MRRNRLSRALTTEGIPQVKSPDYRDTLKKPAELEEDS